MGSALISALSGLRVHQSYLDVIGNNLANASTPGYRGSRITFSDLLSQVQRSGSAPTSAIGGTCDPVAHGAHYVRTSQPRLYLGDDPKSCRDLLMRRRRLRPGFNSGVF